MVLAYGYLTLPARNPYEALNFFRYCLAWFEMPIALVLIILTIFKGMNWACCARGRALSTFARQLYRSGRFSALSFLHMASPPQDAKDSAGSSAANHTAGGQAERTSVD